MDHFTVPSGDLLLDYMRAAARPMRQLVRPKQPLSHWENDRPTMFFFSRKPLHGKRAYGPWLTGGDWWNQTLWGLEQWDLVAERTWLDDLLLRDTRSHAKPMADSGVL